MVLSNAERQKRFRERLKAAARGDDLADRVRDAIEEALRVCIQIAVAESGGGCKLPPERSNTDHPVEQTLEMIASFSDVAGADELAVLDRARSILEAVRHATRASD